MLDLPATIDERLHAVQSSAPPYHARSDHVLNIATYNTLCECCVACKIWNCDGRTKPYLNALGAPRILTPPRRVNPAAYRRFTQDHLDALQEAIDFTAQVSGQSSPTCFSNRRFSTAMAQWSKPMASANREWTFPGKASGGYHPLVISLANTGEVLRLVNRSGNRPSHEGGAHSSLTKASPYAAPPAFARSAFVATPIFSQTQHLDRWHEQGDVTFCFGLDVTGPRLHGGRRSAANSLETAEPVGEIPGQDKTPSAAHGIRQQIVEQRGFEDIRLCRRVDCRAAVSPCHLQQHLPPRHPPQESAGERTATAAIIR